MYIVNESLKSNNILCRILSRQCIFIKYIYRVIYLTSKVTQYFNRYLIIYRLLLRISNVYPYFQSLNSLKLNSTKRNIRS